jgi:hypothetical protein
VWWKKLSSQSLRSRKKIKSRPFPSTYHIVTYSQSLTKVEDSKNEKQIEAIHDENFENGFSLSLYIPPAFYPYIIGKNGNTKKKLESVLYYFSGQLTYVYRKQELL